MLAGLYLYLHIELLYTLLAGQGLEIVYQQRVAAGSFYFLGEHFTTLQ